MPDPDNATLVEMTTDLVADYLSRNPVPPADLPVLIESVHATLSGLGKAPEPVAPDQPKPAVPIRKSITENYLISLEDGRKLKALKRYLAGLGMTPDEYRAKWGLPADYPMVAPAYSARRSELAKSLGLGTARRRA